MLRGMVEDHSLVTRIRRGDPVAYEELVRTHGGEMRAVALRLLMNEAEADDAVQDAFLSAFRALDGFEDRASLGTWLHRIVINAAINVSPDSNTTGFFLSKNASRAFSRPATLHTTKGTLSASVNGASRDAMGCRASKRRARYHVVMSVARDRRQPRSFAVVTSGRPM